jgi:hypothetical protein
VRIIDPGHRYQLNTLDGDVNEVLTFVKRDSPAEKYPGNTGHYAGTTTQEVLRACLDRIRYVNNQIPDDDNLLVIQGLRQCITALERRAARLHNRPAPTDHTAEFGPFCSRCGHVGHACNIPEEAR